MCKCFEGLGYLNGECAVCPLGIDPTNYKCLEGCKANEVLSQSKCICKNGFGYNSNKDCVDCSSISGGFLIDGYCAVCPSTYIYDGANCACPQGTSESSGRCIANCLPGQLTDPNGVCYWCPIN